jgi:hypothetical protein
VRGLSRSRTQSRASYRRAISAASARISASARGNTASMAVSCLTRAAMSRSSIPRLVMYRPGWSGRLPLAADPYCDRNNRPGRGTPSHHPGQVARRAGRDEATGRLRGSLARSRFHRSVAVVRASLGHIQRYRARYAHLGAMSMAKFGILLDSSPVDLWQENSSANRQSGRCVQVEHIGAVLPAPCPLARAGPVENRQRAMMRTCFMPSGSLAFRTRRGRGNRKYQLAHGQHRRLGWRYADSRK